MDIRRTRRKLHPALFSLAILGAVPLASRASSLVEAGYTPQLYQQTTGSTDVSAARPSAPARGKPAASETGLADPATSASTGEIAAIFGIGLFVLVGLASLAERSSNRRTGRRSDRQS